MVCVRAGFAVRVAVALSLSGAALVPGAAAAADITVILDQAKVIKLPDRVTTLVIGNPLIADATIQSGGQLVVTGKGYGATNIIALDPAGNALMDKSIEVLGPRGVVVVYRGVERETYSCAPKLRAPNHARRQQRLFRCGHRRNSHAQWVGNGRGAGGSEIDARCPVPRNHMAASVLSLASR